MKAFWSIVALLILAAASYLALSRKPDAAPSPAPILPQPAPEPPTPTPASSPSPATPKPEPQYPDPDSIADALVSGDWSSTNTRPQETGTPSTANAPSSAPAAQPKKPNTDEAPYLVAPSKIEKKDDGTLLIDDRMIVKGQGTSQAPYEITWDLLTSAERTYEPRSAKRKIPQSIAMLDGKFVRITGYVAFPLYVQQPREFLAMLNQWDGCCIGVPPTPYDAIEVRLDKAITGNDRFANNGVIEGVFGVEPYVTGNWLVGLYVMDHASLKPEGFGGNPTTHGQ